MRKSFQLAHLQQQSRKQNFRRRQGLMNYEIPVFKKVNQKNLRGIINKKLNKIGKFYKVFQNNKIPASLLSEPLTTDRNLEIWKWAEQEAFMQQKNENRLLANTSGDSQRTPTQPRKEYPKDKDFGGLPLVKSKLILKHKGKVAKEFKKKLDAVEQLRNEVSSDLELIQKEGQVFGMNYEEAERFLPTNIQHRHKR